MIKNEPQHVDAGVMDGVGRPLSPHEVRRLATAHIVRATLLTALLMIYLLPMGSYDLAHVTTWLVLLPIVFLLRNLGASQARGSMQIQSFDFCGLAAPAMLLLLPPGLMLLTYVVATNLSPSPRKSWLKFSFNLTSTLAGATVALTVYHLVLSDHSQRGTVGLLAVVLAVPCISLWELVHVQYFLSHFEPGKFQWRTEGGRAGADILVDLVCSIATDAVFVAFSHNLGWLLAAPLLLASLLYFHVIASVRHQTVVEMGPEQAWLAEVRSGAAVDELERLVESLARAVRAQAVVLQTSLGSATFGTIPLTRLTDAVARVQTAGIPEFGHSRAFWDVLRPERLELSVLALRSDGASSFLVISYLTNSTIRVPAMQPGRVTAAADEITRALDRDRTRRALEFAATRDPLTGLRRAASFIDELDLKLGHWGGATVLLVDVGRLRDINDLFGRDAGDALLRSLGHRLESALPTGALTGRIGGHLFGAALPGERPESAVAVGKLLLHVLHRSGVGREGANVIITVGTAVSPDHGVDAATLLRRAQLGLDEATVAGTQLASFSWPAEQRAQRRLKLVPDLQTALLGEEVVAHYQPQVDPVDGHVLGMEALARWTHPELGVIAPDEFVRLAESSGLTQLLTTSMLRQALRECRRLADCGLVVPVAVNLSAQCLTHPGLGELVRRLLAGTQVPAHQLVLEITETAVMERPEMAIATLNELRSLGLRISIDDFGTGQSSLAYLRTLPVDEVKLDRAFTSDLHDPRGVAMVRASVDLAHALGLTIVAEGVEDEASLMALRDLGIDVAQGYHICRPGPPDVIADFLRARARQTLKV